MSYTFHWAAFAPASFIPWLHVPVSYTKLLPGNIEHHLYHLWALPNCRASCWNHWFGPKHTIKATSAVRAGTRLSLYTKLQKLKAQLLGKVPPTYSSPLVTKADCCKKGSRHLMVSLTLTLCRGILGFPGLSPVEMILQLGAVLCSCYNRAPEQQSLYRWDALFSSPGRTWLVPSQASLQCSSAHHRGALKDQATLGLNSKDFPQCVVHSSCLDLTPPCSLYLRVIWGK